MGISGLLPFLKEHVPHVLKPFHGFPTERVRVAIDVPIFAHKFIYTDRVYERLEAHFLRFANELSQTCVPVFVFDGSPLRLKDAEREKRNIARDKQFERFKMKQSQAMEIVPGITIVEASLVPSLGPTVDPVEAPELEFKGFLFPTKQDYRNLKLALETHGHEVFTSKHEAEALCCHLASTNNVWAVVTEDTDALAFGASRVIFRFLSREPIVVEETELLEALHMTRDEFLDLCILMGTDYCTNIKKIGPATALSLVRRFKSWPIIYEKARFGWTVETRNSAEAFHERYPEVRKCFDTCAYEKSIDEKMQDTPE
jgi:flap endonuclease-1